MIPSLTLRITVSIAAEGRARSHELRENMVSKQSPAGPIGRRSVGPAAEASNEARAER